MLKSSSILLAVFVCISVQAQQPPMPPKPPTVAERMAHVKQSLGKDVQLSESDWKKVESVYQQFFKKIDAAIQQAPPKEMPPPPPPVKKEVMDKLVQERDAAVQKVLSATQFQQYAAAVKKMQPPRPPKAPKEPPPHE